MITVLLVDDEPLALRELAAMLANYPEVQVIDTAREADEARDKIIKHRPDLIFLDINMPGKNGFDLLSELDEAPQVVFVTAYDQYAIQAFDVNALDYILKPINQDRLAEAIAKVNRVLEAQQSVTVSGPLSMQRRLFLKDGDQCFFVPVHQIFLVESLGNYVRIHFEQYRPVIHRSLTYMESRLPASDFFRADRQHLINVNFIQKIHPQSNNTLEVILQSGHRVELSQRQSVKFKELLGI